MAAKGSVVKNELMEEFMKAHIGSFSPDGKVIHVDMIENGNPVQIKVAFTAVKTPISNSPKTDIINGEQFFITEGEQVVLEDTLKEMGIEF